MVGDPTGKLSARKQLTREEVLRNAKTYKEQAGRILRFEGKNPVELKYNSLWLEKMSAIEFLQLSHHLTYNQVIERDMFQKRIKQNQDVFMNEFLYPFMQAYDSVAMKVDLEVGGVDQMFNMLMGRKLMRNILKKEKFVMTTPLLTDSQGNKIGKTEGNVIALTSKSNEFFAMVMTLPDEVIGQCFESLTNLPMSEVNSIKNKLSEGENPMTFKKRLAYTLTKMLNSEEEAQTAQAEFEKVVQGGELPTQIQAIRLSANDKITWADFLVNYNLAKSKSEAKRLIDQGSVETNGERVGDPKEVLIPENNTVIKVGKKNFVKLIVE